MNCHRLRAAIRILEISGLAALLLACSGSGRELYIQEGCIRCHRFGYEGGNMGPDLTAVTERRTEKWIAAYLKSPRALNPAARMPSYEHLTWRQRKALIAYLKKGALRGPADPGRNTGK